MSHSRRRCESGETHQDMKCVSATFRACMRTYTELGVISRWDVFSQSLCGVLCVDACLVVLWFVEMIYLSAIREDKLLGRVLCVKCKCNMFVCLFSYAQFVCIRLCALDTDGCRMRMQFMQIHH